MKFRSLVNTYVSHRRHLKVQAFPWPFSRSQACPVWVQGVAEMGRGHLAPRRRLSWVRIPALPLTSCVTSAPLQPDLPSSPEAAEGEMNIALKGVLVLGSLWVFSNWVRLDFAPGPAPNTVCSYLDASLGLLSHKPTPDKCSAEHPRTARLFLKALWVTSRLPFPGLLLCPLPVSFLLSLSSLPSCCSGHPSASLHL